MALKSNKGKKCSKCDFTRTVKASSRNHAIAVQEPIKCPTRLGDYSVRLLFLPKCLQKSFFFRAMTARRSYNTLHSTCTGFGLMILKICVTLNDINKNIVKAMESVISHMQSPPAIARKSRGKVDTTTSRLSGSIASLKLGNA